MEDIDWNKKGVDDFLQLVQSTLQQNENTKAINSQTQHDISKILFTAVMAALRDRDIFSNVLSALNSLLDNPMTMEYIIDVISVIDLETIATDDSDQRTNFINFLSLLQPNLPEDVLKERLDLDTLEAISLLKHTDNFNKRYIKTRTKLYYKQQKFNLFREENEGYSKLITELCNESAISKSQFLINIKSLIEIFSIEETAKNYDNLGKFNLDPNRVVDILLEVLECNPGSSSFFVEVLKDYVVGLDSLPSILGFKFQNYANDPKDTPESLFLVTAILVANDVISLSEIYPHLYPEDEVIIEQHEQAMSAARQTANRLSVAVLSEKEKDKNSDDKDSTSTASSIENQKFGLIEQMIVIGDWKHAQMMLNRFPQFYPVSQGNIAYHMCQLLHYIVEPLYSKFGRLNHSRKSQISLSPYTSNLLPEKCKDFHDISKEFMQILSALGPFCSIDLLLMSKILRLFENYLLHEKQLILCCLDECLIPSLSLLNANCHFSDAVWNVLKHFPYQDRYNLYHEWKTNVISMEPSLILRRSKVTERAKYVMKRLSKDTVKSMGRNLAKLSHCCPTVVFDYVLSQLQKYDNLCLPLIDALKMLTPMSFDVLVYCLIETLSDPTKSRINKENASIELWIYSLSTFSGALFKKFTVDTTGLIQYIANQLKAGNNFNLIILKEIVSKMTGVKIFDDLTEDELSAHGGGEFLKSEAAFQGLVRQSQKSSRRLKDTMLEHHLAFPLCILLANHRDSIVYNDGEEGHLKLIGSLYDECQDAFVQMVEFLDVSLSLDEFEALPDLDTLSSNYELSPDAAFYLSRPKLNRKINALASAYKDAVDKICSPLLKMVECLQPIKVWDHLNPQFYLTFWSLGLYDIHCPTDAYDKEISKLNSQIKTVESSSDFSENKKKKEKEKLTLMVDKLKDECKKHNEHVIRVMARLKLECPQWFPSRTGKSECIVRLQQTCLIPRTLFSTPDAVFCAQFFVLVHTLKTVNFPTLLCLDRLFTDLVYSLASFTENEARRYGRFLHAILTVVTKWHGDKTIYDRECSNYPGFFMSVRNTSNLMSGGAGGRDVILDYDNFRHVCYKWQFKIARDVITCLETGDYIQIRNTIIVLTKLIPHFPRCTNLGIAVEKRIEKVRAEEKDNRQDLCMLATSYIGKLKQHKPKMMAEEVFHNKKERENKLQKQAPKSKHPLTNGTDNSVSPVNAKRRKSRKFQLMRKNLSEERIPNQNLSEKSVEDTKVKTEASSYSLPPLTHPLWKDFKPQHSPTPPEEPITNKTTLDNGLVAASQNLAGPFCTIGIAVKSGARYEALHKPGVNHFLEKLAFKSTKNRFIDGDSVLKEIDHLGGIADCQIGRDIALYAMSVKSSNLDPALELLSEILFQVNISDAELETARQAVLFDLRDQESAESMMRLEPKVVLEDMVHQAAYRNNTLGFSRFASYDSAKSMSREALMSYLKSYYVPSRITIAGVGMHHEDLVKSCSKHFTKYDPSFSESTCLGVDESIAQYTGGLFKIERDMTPFSGGDNPLPELTHVMLGFESVPISHPDYIPSMLLSFLLGGGGSFSAGGPGKGMYSRLYLNVLNKHHWIFHASCQQHFYADTSLFTIQASAHPTQLRDLLQVIIHELIETTSSTINSIELIRAKRQLQSQLLTNLETRPVIFEDIARQMIQTGKRQTSKAFIEIMSSCHAERSRNHNEVWQILTSLTLITYAFKEYIKIEDKLNLESPITNKHLLVKIYYQLLEMIDSVSEKEIITCAQNLLKSSISVAALGKLDHLPSLKEIQTALAYGGKFPRKNILVA